MNREQQEQIGFIVMWVKDWQVGFEFAVAKALGRNVELTPHQRYQMENMAWFAHMALKECEELGLDPSLVLTEAMITHANEWRAELAA